MVKYEHNFNKHLSGRVAVTAANYGYGSFIDLGTGATYQLDSKGDYKLSLDIGLLTGEAKAQADLFGKLHLSATTNGTATAGIDISKDENGKVTLEVGKSLTGGQFMRITGNKDITAIAEKEHISEKKLDWEKLQETVSVQNMLVVSKKAFADQGLDADKVYAALQRHGNIGPDGSARSAALTPAFRQEFPQYGAKQFGQIETVLGRFIAHSNLANNLPAAVTPVAPTTVQITTEGFNSLEELRKLTVPTYNGNIVLTTRRGYEEALKAQNAAARLTVYDRGVNPFIYVNNETFQSLLNPDNKNGLKPLSYYEAEWKQKGGKVVLGRFFWSVKNRLVEFDAKDQVLLPGTYTLTDVDGQTVVVTTNVPIRVEPFKEGFRMIRELKEASKNGQQAFVKDGEGFTAVPKKVMDAEIVSRFNNGTEYYAHVNFGAKGYAYTDKSGFRVAYADEPNQMLVFGGEAFTPVMSLVLTDNKVYDTRYIQPVSSVADITAKNLFALYPEPTKPAQPLRTTLVTSRQVIPGLDISKFNAIVKMNTTGTVVGLVVSPWSNKAPAAVSKDKLLPADPVTPVKPSMPVRPIAPVQTQTAGQGVALARAVAVPATQTPAERTQTPEQISQEIDRLRQELKDIENKLEAAGLSKPQAMLGVTGPLLAYNGSNEETIHMVAGANDARTAASSMSDTAALLQKKAELEARIRTLEAQLKAAQTEEAAVPAAAQPATAAASANAAVTPASPAWTPMVIGGVEQNMTKQAVLKSGAVPVTPKVAPTTKTVEKQANIFVILLNQLIAWFKSLFSIKPAPVQAVRATAPVENIGSPAVMPEAEIPAKVPAAKVFEAMAASKLPVGPSQLILLEGEAMDQFLASNYRVDISSGAATQMKGQFISFKDLQKTDIRQALRSAKILEATKMGRGGKDVARLYLGEVPAKDVLEVISGKASSLYYPADLDSNGEVLPGAQPFAVTKSVDNQADGFRHVTTTYLLPANRGMVSEMVYQLKPNAKPVKQYRVDYVYAQDSNNQTRLYKQEKVTFNEKGDEIVVEDQLGQDGVDALFWGGRLYKKVLRIAKTEHSAHKDITTIASFQNYKSNGGYVLFSRMEFTDGIKTSVYTCSMHVTDVRNPDVLLNKVTMDDFVYGDIYLEDGTRNVFINPRHMQNGVLVKSKWEHAWTIGKEEMNPLSSTLLQNVLGALAKDPDALREFRSNINLRPGDYLSATKVMYPEDVSSLDYRYPQDNRARKLITVRSEKGEVIKTIVGTRFDPVTGEQKRAYVIEQGDITGIFEYLSGDDFAKDTHKPQIIKSNRAGDIFTDEVAKVMVRAFENRMKTTFKHYGSGVAGFWKFMNAMGISKETHLTVIREYPKLIEVHNGVARYADNKYGQAKYHFLLPNDSRGRDVAILYADQSLELQLWALEGDEKILVRYNGDDTEKQLPQLKVGLRPGSIIANLKDLNEHAAVQMLQMPDQSDSSVNFDLIAGEYSDKDAREKNTFTRTNVVTARVRGGENAQFKITLYPGTSSERNLTAYRYMTMDAKRKLSQFFTPAGRTIMEHFAHQTAQVGKGVYGDTFLNEEYSVLDVSSQIRKPLGGTWRDPFNNNEFRQIKWFDNKKTEYSIIGGERIPGGQRIVNADQKTVEYVWEGEGMDATKFQEQRSEFMNGELLQGRKSVNMVFEKWRDRFGTWAVLFTTVSVLVASLFVTMKIVAWLAQAWRRRLDGEDSIGTQLKASILKKAQGPAPDDKDQKLSVRLAMRKVQGQAGKAAAKVTGWLGALISKLREWLSAFLAKRYSDLQDTYKNKLQDSNKRFFSGRILRVFRLDSLTPFMQRFELASIRLLVVVFHGGLHTVIKQVQMQHAVSEIEALCQTIASFPTLGAQTGAVNVVKRTLQKELRARLYSGYALHEVYERYWRNYRKKYVVPVLSKLLGEGETYRAYLREVQGFGLFEMYLYGLVKVESGHLANVTSAPSFYWFYLMQKMYKELKDEQHIRPVDMTFMTDKFELDHSVLWSLLLHVQMRIGRSKGWDVSTTIHHDDVEGFFSSVPFLQNYINPDGQNKDLHTKLWDYVIKIAQVSSGREMKSRQEAWDYFRKDPKGLSIKKPEIKDMLSINALIGKVYPDIATKKFGWNGWIRMAVNFGRRLAVIFGATGVAAAGILAACSSSLVTGALVAAVGGLLTLLAYATVKFFEDSKNPAGTLAIGTVGMGISALAVYTAFGGLITHFLAAFTGVISLGVLVYRGIKYLDAKTSNKNLKDRKSEIWDHVTLEQRSGFEREGGLKHHVELGYEHRHETGNREGRIMRSWLIMGTSVVLKLVMNFFVWMWIAIPVHTLALSKWIIWSLTVPFGGYLLASLGVSLFVFMFMLDIFAYYYFLQSFLGYAIGKQGGNNSINHWRRSHWGIAVHGAMWVGIGVLSQVFHVPFALTILNWFSGLPTTTWLLAVVAQVGLAGSALTVALYSLAGLMMAVPVVNLFLRKVNFEQIGNDSVVDKFGVKEEGQGDSYSVKFKRHGAMWMLMRKLIPPTTAESYGQISLVMIIDMLKSSKSAKLNAEIYKEKTKDLVAEGDELYRAMRESRTEAANKVAREMDSIKEQANAIWSALLSQNIVYAATGNNGQAVYRVQGNAALDSLGAKLQDKGVELDNNLVELLYWTLRYQRRDLSEDERMIAAAKAWNLIIKAMREDDLISDIEKKRYSFGIQEDVDYYLGGRITSIPNLKTAPVSRRVADRLQKWMSSLYMNMEYTPIWELMYNFSVVLPVNDEPVLYPFADMDVEDYESINSPYKNGLTFLTHIIKIVPAEWSNFYQRVEQESTETYLALRKAMIEAGALHAQGLMSKEAMEAAQKEYADFKIEYARRKLDIQMMKNLKLGQRLGVYKYVPADKSSRHVLYSQYMETQVMMWASYRFQPLGRSIRGIMRYRETYEWLAKVNFGDAEAARAINESMFAGREDVRKQAALRVASGEEFNEEELVRAREDVNWEPRVREALAKLETKERLSPKDKNTILKALLEGVEPEEGRADLQAHINWVRAQVNYEIDIARLVDEKFEYDLGHQPYGTALNAKEGSKSWYAVQHINYMMRRYPSIQLIYLHDAANGNTSEVINTLSKIQGVNADQGKYDVEKFGFASAVDAFVDALQADDTDKEEIRTALKDNKMPNLAIEGNPHMSRNRALREQVINWLRSKNSNMYIDNFAGARVEYRYGGQARKGEDILFIIRDESGRAIGRMVRREIIEIAAHYFVGQGKPLNQNNLGRFVSADIMQLMDINQDMYLEETLKAPNLQEDFRDEDVCIVGFPEDIFTDDFSPAGVSHATGDHTFVTITQRTLNFKGIRFHYGHPDMVRVLSFRQLGLFSAPWVNEDIFGAYKATLLGEKVLYHEIMQAAKARESVYIGMVGISDKFGAGAGEQAVGQKLYEFNHSKIIGGGRAFAHSVGAVGYFLRKPLVVIQNTLYALVIIMLGTGFFVGFPDELMWGLVGMLLSQAIGSSGWLQLVLERGFLAGTLEEIRRFPILAWSYMSLIPNAFSNGLKKAYINSGNYVATGRRAGRQTVIPFFDTCGYNDTAVAKQGDVYGQINFSGFTYVVSVILIALGGLLAWMSPGEIWSLMPVWLGISGLLSAFLFNAGSTPVTVGVGSWWKQHIFEHWPHMFAKFGAVMRWVVNPSYMSNIYSKIDQGKIAAGVDQNDIPRAYKDAQQLKNFILGAIGIVSGIGLFLLVLLLKSGLPYLEGLLVMLVVYPLIGILEAVFSKPVQHKRQVWAAVVSLGFIMVATVYGLILVPTLPGGLWGVLALLAFPLVSVAARLISAKEKAGEKWMGVIGRGRALFNLFISSVFVMFVLFVLGVLSTVLISWPYWIGLKIRTTLLQSIKKIGPYVRGGAWIVWAHVLFMQVAPLWIMPLGLITGSILFGLLRSTREIAEIALSIRNKVLPLEQRRNSAETVEIQVHDGQLKDLLADSMNKEGVSETDQPAETEWAEETAELKQIMQDFVEADKNAVPAPAAIKAAAKALLDGKNGLKSVALRLAVTKEAAVRLARQAGMNAADAFVTPEIWSELIAGGLQQALLEDNGGDESKAKQALWKAVNNAQHEMAQIIVDNVFTGNEAIAWRVAGKKIWNNVYTARLHQALVDVCDGDAQKAQQLLSAKLGDVKVIRARQILAGKLMLPKIAKKLAKGAADDVALARRIKENAADEFINDVRWGELPETFRQVLLEANQGNMAAARQTLWKAVDASRSAMDRKLLERKYGLTRAAKVLVKTAAGDVVRANNMDDKKAAIFFVTDARWASLSAELKGAMLKYKNGDETAARELLWQSVEKAYRTQHKEARPETNAPPASKKYKWLGPVYKVFVGILTSALLASAIFFGRFMDESPARPDSKAVTEQVATPSSALKFEPVTVSGRQILRGGKPYIIHGVTLSTAKLGQGRNDLSMSLDYIGGEWALQAMHDAGINSVRALYAPTPDLLEALARHGITATISMPYVDDRNVALVEKIDIKKGGFSKYIQDNKNQPAILMYELGREDGYGSALLGHNVEQGYKIIRNAAREIHSTDPNHPVAVAPGKLARISDETVFDLIGLNFYPDVDSGVLVADWQQASGKPVYLSEFGILYTTDDVEQAQGLKVLWSHVQEGIDAGVLSGGYYMTWQSEAWKGGNPSVQDNNVEENLGVIDLDGVCKPAYNVLKQLWNVPAAGYNVPIQRTPAKQNVPSGKSAPAVNPAPVNKNVPVEKKAPATKPAPAKAPSAKVTVPASPLTDVSTVRLGRTTSVVSQLAQIAATPSTVDVREAGLFGHLQAVLSTIFLGLTAAMAGQFSRRHGRRQARPARRSVEKIKTEVDQVYANSSLESLADLVNAADIGREDIHHDAL
ncbi:MAG: hypothetical protein HGA80_03985, partial [Candidatus Omnitrophica bacterium]|nr:hypothetical protein [Candidatus Omnitrophota bacterium]